MTSLALTLNEYRALPNKRDGVLYYITDDILDTPRMKPKNCVNCGVVLKGYTCDYCGTEY